MEYTLADRELAGYENDLTVIFQGRKYPVWVIIEKLLRIVDKDGRCVNLIMNQSQIELYKRICEQRRAKRPVRINVLKARQIGYSTLIAALFFVIGMFTPNMKVGVVADIEKHARNIFEKYQFFYDHLDDSNPNKEEIDAYARENGGKLSPLSYKPRLKAQRGQQMLWTQAGNSMLEVIVAGESSGRSTTYQLLHLTECAFFENLKVTLNGLLETVSSKNKDSMIFLETTANGINEYKERWDKDITGKTSYDAVFTPWFTNPEYSDDEYEAYAKTHDGKQKELPLLEEWLYEKQQLHNLTNAQVKWYWDKYQDKGDKSIALQEYPFSPMDAFMTSGNCIFNAELVNKRKEEVLKQLPFVKQGMFTYEKSYSLDGSVIEIKNDKFREYRNGAISIFKDVDPTHPYVGICDPNNGGSDDAAIQIIDNYTGEQVARLKSNELSLDIIAFQFYLLGKYYNWALLSNEMNLGKVVMDYLIKMKYPKLYLNQNQSFDDYRQNTSKKYGHLTTRGNRQFMIDSFQIAFKQNPSIINDYDTLTQMETFQKVEHVSRNDKKTYKTEASSGAHDDLVTSFMAFYLVRNQQTAVPSSDLSTNGKRKFNSIEEAQDFYEKKMLEITAPRSNLQQITGIRF